MDGKRYGLGNRPYWETKEGWVQSWHPNLIEAVSKEQDPSCRRPLFESHRYKIGATNDISRMQINREEQGFLANRTAVMQHRAVADSWIGR